MSRARPRQTSPAERLSNTTPACWVIDADGARCVEAVRAPWQTGAATDPSRAYVMPPVAPAPEPRVYVASGARWGVVDEVNLYRASRGWAPLCGALSDDEAARARAGYAEHASYPIEITLSLCGCCGAVAARCPCHYRHRLEVGASPTVGRAPCTCGAPVAARAA